MNHCELSDSQSQGCDCAAVLGGSPSADTFQLHADPLLISGCEDLAVLIRVSAFYVCLDLQRSDLRWSAAAFQRMANNHQSATRSNEFAETDIMGVCGLPWLPLLVGRDRRIPAWLGPNPLRYVVV